MNTSKISELSSVSTLTNNDILPIVNGGDTKQVSIEKLQDILASKEYVDDAISALGALGFTPVIVSSLPTENIDIHTIYLLPGSNISDNNIYEEWLYINNSWEMIGTTGGGSITLDDTVTETSENGVKSSGIYDALLDKMDLVGKLIVAFGIGTNVTYPTAIGDSVTIDTPSNTTDIYHMEEFRKYLDDNYSSSDVKIFTFINDIVVLRSLNVSSTSAGVKYGGYGRTLSGKHVRVDFLKGTMIQKSVIKSITITLYEDSSINFSNTIVFTPTDNYHPATKKYVDDQVGSINTVLATLTTVGEE